ncbi:MAG TPA: polyprenyl synthetase family protein [Candidatus Thermoplasmatota archaeon]|nr:polyprenyl synthetase family protein [Candidatus Thermoplasmatota archaeon]
MTLAQVMASYRRQADRAVATYLKEGEQRRLAAAMAWIPLAGGKRLRPVLTQMVAEAVGGAPAAKAALPVGVALEVIHNFTLVHDDIMDRSELRRGRRTVHLKWDEATAINAGDALFARAFEILGDTPVEDPLKVEIFGRVATMVRRISEGQQQDMEFERAKSVTRAQYLRMVERKTALMFSTAAYCGARVGGARPALAGDLEEYGRLLGIAFQIQDDLLDLGALEEDLGKPIGKDLRNGKRTVMAIDALEALKGAKLRAFKAVLGDPEAGPKAIAGARALMESCGALDRARRLAAAYGEGARERLKALEPSPARGRLGEFVGFVTSRSK